jgi:hypothetical protein
MNAGDPLAAEAGRLISEQKADFLQAWFQWWTRARLPLACTPADIANMTPEEVVLSDNYTCAPTTTRSVQVVVGA